MPESIVEQGEGAHALDTLIWNALSTRQAEFAVPGERVLRFQPEVAPFAALADLTPASSRPPGDADRADLGVAVD
ncbi:hypothetical protein PPH41_07320, partial [Burkholderia gladioli]|nr:hypothetical protein [Burkholderia gladioli]